MCYDPYNNKLIALGKKTVFVADPVAGKPNIQTLIQYPQGIAGMALLQNGVGRVAIICNDSSLQLLDYKNTGLSIRKNLDYQPHTLAISPDGKTLFIGGMKHSSTKGGEPVGVVEAVSFAQAGDILTLRALPIANLKPVYSLAIAPDGGRMAIGTAGGNIVLWDRRQEIPVADFQQHTRQSVVYQVLFDKTGRFLISAGADKKVLMRDTESEGSIPARLATTTGWCRWAYLTGGHVLSGGNEKGFWVSSLLAQSLNQLLVEAQTGPLSRKEWQMYMPEDVEYNHFTPDRDTQK
jgi:WD40 repeat protein